MMKDVQTYEAKQDTGIILNANEYYANLSDAVIKELQEALVDIAFHRYPDASNQALIQAYADVMKISSSNILAGNGSDEMLGLMISYFLGKDKTLYTLAPDFSMYDYYVGMNEATIEKFTCEADGAFDVDEFIARGKQVHADMIVFSNPNNPTGHLVKVEQVKKIIQAFQDIPVIIDEAYAEFANESILSFIDEASNLYVTRTLSKAYGLAGARLGFLLSNEENIQRLKPYVVPYNISSIAQQVGVVVLSHASECRKHVDEIIQARDQMYEQVKNFTRVTCYPSQANYLYGRSEQKATLLALFQRHDISIRDYANQDSFRITIGSKEENALVLQILQAFEKEGS